MSSKIPVEYKIPSLLLISAFIVAGCSSDGSSEPNTDIQNETGTTTDTDTGTTTILGTDTGIVTGTDAGSVTDTDSSTTVTGTDAGTVTGNDTGTGGENTSSPATVGLAKCSALFANGGSSASIAGLYNVSDTFEPNLVDVAYLEISNNGTMTLYDYQQDDFDEGDNCYIIESGVSVLSPLEKNEFVSTLYIDEDENCDIITEQATIIRTETELTATFVDTDDEDDDGDTTELISDVLPVATGLTTESFNHCE